MSSHEYDPIVELFVRQPQLLEQLLGDKLPPTSGKPVWKVVSPDLLEWAESQFEGSAVGTTNGDAESPASDSN
ncbi:hypothetical protein [Yinghuangia sp. YIM S09857]|uniref:hypothetical protein n=1 Tax=Yinghuangia sp. YIM S09857 TaxID=3436929 RepID=UPI003F52B458